MTPDEMRRAAEILDSLTQQPGFGRCPDYAPLARLLREEADSQGWRDIATAPRDGTRVLLCSPRGRIADGEFGNYKVWSWPYVMVEPTHWRPLPPPPQGREG